MGAWRNNGVKRKESSAEANGSNGIETMQGNVYTLRRMYFKNISSPDLKKYVSYIEGSVIVSNSVSLVL